MSINDTKRTLLREMLIFKRKEKKLTQHQLAEELQKPQSFVSKYESGERKLDFVELIEILQLLKVPPNEFIDDFCKKLK